MVPPDALAVDNMRIYFPVFAVNVQFAPVPMNSYICPVDGDAGKVSVVATEEYLTSESRFDPLRWYPVALMTPSEFIEATSVLV